MLSTILRRAPTAIRPLLIGALCLSAWAAAGRARAQVNPAPEGAEFRANTYTTGSQAIPAVASDPNGGFVIVWQTAGGQDGAGYGIAGQRFAASGTRLGSEFQVNTYTTGHQRFPSVASDANGNFVVVWASDGQDGNQFGVFGRRYAASGLSVGTEFQINSFTSGKQQNAIVACAPNGDFVVVWEGEGQDGNGFGVFGQRFDGSGAPRGSEFQINTYTTAGQRFPNVAVDPVGNFVVVWHSNGGGGPDVDYGVVARLYDASGTAASPEFQVNSYTTGFQVLPRATFDRNGNFVVVWMDYAKDGSSSGIFGRRFDPTGTPFGSDFQVNTYTTGIQYLPSVAADENDDFVVVWAGSGQDGSSFGIFGQQFDPLGPRGSEFRINTYSTGSQFTPAIAQSPDGDFIVSWTGYGDQDGNLAGVFAQRYGDIIFEDGFESGDLTRWSSASTGGGDVSVTGAAALANTAHGMQAVVNDTTGIYVLDDSPSAEKHYRARFYFDTNGFDPGEAQSHFRTRIFIAFDNAGQRQITVVLKRQSGQYSVQGRVRLNDGTRADTGFITIPAGENFVEVAWNRASRDGVSDGDFVLIVNGNGESTITLTGLDNSAANVEFARLGAMSVKTGASGTLFFDQFESRRVTPIGAECCQQF
jgi:hypothetical protein